MKDMNKAKKFTLLLMHDNGKTTRFRLGKKTLVFLVTCAIVIPILLVGLGFVSYMLFKENTSIHVQLLEQEKALADAHYESQRLAHLQVFLEDVNPNSIQQIVAQNTVLESQKPDIPLDAPELAFVPPEIDTEEFIAAEESLTILEDPAETGILYSAGLLRIEALNVRPQTNNTRIAVNFDLYNSGQQNQIAGDCQFTLVRENPDGTSTDVPLTKRDHTSFRINKLKKMSTVLQMPQGSFTDKDVLRMDILVNDTISYTQLIPLG